MSSSPNELSPRRTLQGVVHDLAGLFGIQAALLLLTCVLTPWDAGDVRIQIAWTLFLLPGWWFSGWWTAGHARLAIRYMHAVLSAIAIHGCIAGFASFAVIGFSGYYSLFFAVSLGLLVLRWFRIRSHGSWLRLPRPGIELAMWIAVMVFVVCIFRQPRSADIIQFVMQQQDMAREQSLQPSPIGMSAMGVSEAMPRWRAHLWHAVPSLMGNATSLPIDGVLRRWAPIPIGFSVLAVLMTVVRRMSGRRVEWWCVALAVFFPIVLWYRSYNAFNYSFRLTNNFCLDKDLCVFLLVPGTVYLAVRWIGGCRRSIVPLLLLIPAILKFHPMTAVYLVLLLPFVVIGYDRESRFGSLSALTQQGQSLFRFALSLWPSAKAWCWIGAASCLLILVFVIGDAQTAHEQIAGILETDWADYSSGRPLHYWVGLYTGIENHQLALDTSEWIDGKLSLKSRVLLNCGLLGAMHVAWFICLLASWRSGRSRDIRRSLALTIVLAMLWGMWFVSPWFLTWKPHYLAGYERLHWFAYLPALIAVTTAAAILAERISFQGFFRKRDATGRFNDSMCRWICSWAVVLLLCYSAITFRAQGKSIWARVPYLNSLLDFELPRQIAREQAYAAGEAMIELDLKRPDYLREDDRVLFLENSGNDEFWLIKQGVFWSEPYAEAFAWQLRGDLFLADRRMFYDLLDRKPVNDVAAWLDDKGVDLIVDRRPGADEYLRNLSERHGLNLHKVSPGVWRRSLNQQ